MASEYGKFFWETGQRITLMYKMLSTPAVAATSPTQVYCGSVKSGVFEDTDA